MPEKLELSINQKLFISRDGGDWYVTSVQQLDKNEFSVAMPYHMSQPLILQRGDKVTVKFAGENAAYQFKTQVTGRSRDQVPLYVLALPEQCNRIQQRNFVRLPLLIPVKYAVVPEKDKEPQFQEGIIIDLSGGGMKLALKDPYRPGVILILDFQLKIREEIVNFRLKGQIKRLEVKELENKRRVFHAGIEFLNISRRDQDKIVAYIFARMVKQNQLR